MWCGSLAFCRHVSETQTLTFFLESRTLLGRQLIVCGRRENSQPFPWLMGTLPSPPNSEDQFISVSFSSSRNRHGPRPFSWDFKVEGTFTGKATTTEMWVSLKQHYPGPCCPMGRGCLSTFWRNRERFLLLLLRFLLSKF